MATTTATKTKADTQAPQQAPQGRQEVTISQPRLSYYPAIKERFGIDLSDWRVLVEAIFPAAKTVEGVIMALAYCKSRKLDIFKRPVHVVPIWDSAKRAYIETVWPGINELRTTAFRTGLYAGCDETTFGPEKTAVFEGEITKKDASPKKVKATVAFPEWAQITLYRMVGNHRVAIVGPKVYWLESYATMGNTEVPNDMWQSRPRGQLEKCAEAAALRKAFPEEIGNEYAAEEMEGRSVGPGSATIIDHEPVRTEPAPPRPTAPTATTSKPRPEDDPAHQFAQHTGGVVDREEEEEHADFWSRTSYLIPLKDGDAAAWKPRFIRALEKAPDGAAVNKLVRENVEQLPDELVSEIETVALERIQQLRG